MRSPPIPQMKLHRFSGQGHDHFGFVRALHLASRHPRPLTQAWRSVDTHVWRLVVEKSAPPLLAESDERLPRLARGHTSPD
jgi:hypothetical protein